MEWEGGRYDVQGPKPALAHSRHAAHISYASVRQLQGLGFGCQTLLVPGPPGPDQTGSGRVTPPGSPSSTCPISCRAPQSTTGAFPYAISSAKYLCDSFLAGASAKVNIC